MLMSQSQFKIKGVLMHCTTGSDCMSGSIHARGCIWVAARAESTNFCPLLICLLLIDNMHKTHVGGTT